MADDTLIHPDSQSATQSPHRLIASNRVEGTAVYNREGEKLGRIENFMVDKVSGRSEYAVMSFGGFLGIGDQHHPVPWSSLTYDTNAGGYVIDADRARLQGAPVYKSSETPNWSDRQWGQRVHQYYGVRPYWE
jgi:sporulation protein YlmC with PRC-barrel domain